MRERAEHDLICCRVHVYECFSGGYDCLVFEVVCSNASITLYRQPDAQFFYLAIEFVPDSFEISIEGMPYELVTKLAECRQKERYDAS